MKIYMKDGKALSNNKQFFTPKPTGETWVLNEGEGVSYWPINKAVTFLSNNTLFYGLSGSVTVLVYWLDNSGDDVVPVTIDDAEYVTFTDQAYRTITFLEPPTGDLLEWLNGNGVKQ